MRREVLEETGLDLAEAAAGSGYYAAHTGLSSPLCGIFQLSWTADQLVARIGRHMRLTRRRR